MSRASSPSSGRRYGTARVCQLWEVPRSTVYARRARASRPAQPAAKRGPKGAGTDAALTEQIRAVLARSPFIGEGYRKAWARLRLAGVRTSKGRVLRLMRAAGLLAPTRVGRRRGPRNHDGTITTDRPDELWGTDATACLTTREGNATVFIAVDHCTQERVGIHAARPGTRCEALEPLRQGLRAHHGGYGPGVAAGLRPAPRPRQPVPQRPLPGRAALPRHPLEPVVRGRTRRQRLRRVLHPHAQGAAALGGAVRDGPAAAPPAARVQGPLQPEVPGRAPRPPHPGRRPPGALAEHRSGCMITASEVSKKSGAVQGAVRAPRHGGARVLDVRPRRESLAASAYDDAGLTRGYSIGCLTTRTLNCPANGNRRYRTTWQRRMRFRGLKFDSDTSGAAVVSAFARSGVARRNQGV